LLLILERGGSRVCCGNRKKRAVPAVIPLILESLNPSEVVAASLIATPAKVAETAEKKARIDGFKD
jgi:hypothetical protein